MDLNKRYFIAYEFSMHEESDGTFVDLATSNIYRKRLLYDCGWGQEEGYEMLLPLSFPDLNALVECYSPLKKEREKQCKGNVKRPYPVLQFVGGSL